MNSMDDLVAFYRARLDEMERAAMQTNEDEYAWNVSISTSYGSIDHAELHTPSRALRRVAAGRKLIELCEEALRIQNGFRESGYEEGRREVLELDCRLRVYEWDDHPDYREEWKPV